MLSSVICSCCKVDSITKGREAEPAAPRHHILPGTHNQYS